MDLEHWKEYPDELNVEKLADIEWAKQSGDPLVWHTVALTCMIFGGDRHDFLAWLVQQPTLDRVTAAAMFLHGSNGVHFLKGEHLNLPRLKETQVKTMIESLCVFDTTRMLADNGIGMDPDWETERLEAVSALTTESRMPKRILGKPIDRQTAKMPYTDLGDSPLVSQRWLRENMPFMLD